MTHSLRPLSRIHAPRTLLSSSVKTGQISLRPLSRIHAPRTGESWQPWIPQETSQTSVEDSRPTDISSVVKPTSISPKSQTSVEDSRPTDTFACFGNHQNPPRLRPLSRIHAPRTQWRRVVDYADPLRLRPLSRIHAPRTDHSGNRGHVYCLSQTSDEDSRPTDAARSLCISLPLLVSDL